MKNYELRNLCADDIFPCANIIKKIGLRQFKELFAKDEVRNAVSVLMRRDESTEEERNEAVFGTGLSFVADVLDIILTNLESCKLDLYQLVSQVANIKLSEVGKLPFNDFVQILVQILDKEEFADFFKLVFRFVK